MEPPSPPSPPLGPPFSMNFSRRKLMQPLPPSPAFTKIDTSSTNFMGYASRHKSRQNETRNTGIQKQKSPVARQGFCSNYEITPRRLQSSERCSRSDDRRRP